MNGYEGGLLYSEIYQYFIVIDGHFVKDGFFFNYFQTPPFSGIILFDCSFMSDFHTSLHISISHSVGSQFLYKHQ